MHVAILRTIKYLIFWTYRAFDDGLDRRQAK